MAGQSAPQVTKTNMTGTSDQTSSVSLPDFLQPFLKGLPGVASGALTSLQAGAAGPQVADFNPDQMAAFDMARNFGTSAPFMDTLKALQETGRGDFLYGGPGFDQAVSAAQRAAMPAVFSTFGGAGRGTGGLAQTAIAQSGQDAFARMFGDERSRQMAALSAIPNLSMLPADLLSKIGAMQQQLAQQKITAPQDVQARLLASSAGIPGAFSPLFGQSQTGTTTQKGRTVAPATSSNILSGALGGGLAGGSLAAALATAGLIGTGGMALPLMLGGGALLGGGAGLLG